MIYQCYFHPKQQSRLFPQRPYQAFGLEPEVNSDLLRNCPELERPEHRMHLLEFAAMLHLWRNPPDDGDDWIGFTSYRQLDKSPVLFRAGEIEAALQAGDVITWLLLRLPESVAGQAERVHPGIMPFLTRMFQDVGLGDVTAFGRAELGIYASYWAVRKTDFHAHMCWFAPAIDYCLHRLGSDPYLKEHPKAASYALERLFMAWCWQTGKRVLDFTGTQPDELRRWAGPGGPPAWREMDQRAVEEAHRLYQAGEIDTAARLCRPLAQARPPHAEAVRLLALIAPDAGQVPPAGSLLQEIHAMSETPEQAAQRRAVSAQGSAAADEPWLEVLGSRHFPAWLAEQQQSLAFTTYQTGKLFLIGLRPDGQLSVFERTFNRAMGLWSNGPTLWMSSQYQLWRFENALPPGGQHQGYDALYVPRVGYTTGDLDVHDIVVEDSGRVVFAATAFGCLGTVSERLSFQPLWRPPFLSQLINEDRCHLNGVALRDGRVRYVTTVSRSDVVDGWRDQRQDGGCVLDVQSGAVVVAGLSMPHSPRWYRGQLWLLNSGAGQFGRVDVEAGRFEPVAFCPGYLRGLVFVGDYAVVTLSKPRHDRTFGGLALDGELARRGAAAQCGLQVIDLRSGAVVHWVRVEGMVSELYDVVAVPGVRRPMALGLKTDEIQRLLAVEVQGRL